MYSNFGPKMMFCNSTQIGGIGIPIPILVLFILENINFWVHEFSIKLWLNQTKNRNMYPHFIFQNRYSYSSIPIPAYVAKNVTRGFRFPFRRLKQVSRHEMAIFEQGNFSEM